MLRRYVPLAALLVPEGVLRFAAQVPESSLRWRAYAMVLVLTAVTVLALACGWPGRTRRKMLGEQSWAELADSYPMVFGRGVADTRAGLWAVRDSSERAHTVVPFAGDARRSPG
jgi:hypothetical protein